MQRRGLIVLVIGLGGESECAVVGSASNTRLGRTVCHVYLLADELSEHATDITAHEGAQVMSVLRLGAALGECIVPNAQYTLLNARAVLTELRFELAPTHLGVELAPEPDELLGWELGLSP